MRSQPAPGRNRQVASRKSLRFPSNNRESREFQDHPLLRAKVAELRVEVQPEGARTKPAWARELLPPGLEAWAALVPRPAVGAAPPPDSAAARWRARAPLASAQREEPEKLP